MKKQTAPKDRGTLMLAELLEQDTHPPRGGDYPTMTIAVRDWLDRFIANEPVPPESMNNPDSYRDTRWVCAVLDDEAVVIGDSLPGPALDCVYQYLQELEEETDIHIYNTGQVARAALPLMIDITSATDSSAILAAVKTAFALHCTEKERMDFLQRHGLRDDRYSDDEWAAQMETRSRDHNAAMDAAHILADENTPEEFKGQLMDEILNFSSATNVYMWHPALVERALVLMFESMDKRITGRYAKSQTLNRKQTYERFHVLLAEISNAAQMAMPAQEGGTSGN